MYYGLNATQLFEKRKPLLMALIEKMQTREKKITNKVIKKALLALYRVCIQQEHNNYWIAQVCTDIVEKKHD